MDDGAYPLSTNGKEILNALGRELNDQFVEPFKKIKELGKPAFDGQLNYCQAQELGRNVAKATEALLTVFTLGEAAVAKLGPKVEKLFANLPKSIEEKAIQTAKKNETAISGENGNLEKEIYEKAAAERAKQVEGTGNIKISKEVEIVNARGNLLENLTKLIW